MLVPQHRAFGPCHVGVRDPLQCERKRLDHEIVDRDFVGRLAVLVLRRGGVGGGARGPARAWGAVGGGGGARTPAAAPAGAEGAVLAGFGAAPFPAAAAAALTSSPSSANTAMSALTGTSGVPSGTTIFASVPSSTASYSIVALSVSISAMTSPGLTLSPSFLSHLARLPLSIVGESAGIRMLTGMTALGRLADRAGAAGISRRVYLRIEHRADPLERLVLGQFGFLGEDTRGVSRDVGDEHAPGLRVVEGATQRDVQPPFYDGGAQDLDAAVLERGRRNVKRIECRHGHLTGSRPPSPPRPRLQRKGARFFRDWPRKAWVRLCR